MTQHAADRGFTLADRLAHPTPMTPLEVALVGHQLAVALDAWHRGGAAHRAIDPSAVEVQAAPDGRLQARLRPPVDGGRAAERYRAPEQVSGRPVGPAADVFALGVVLLDGLTGRRDAPVGVPADLGSAWRYLLTGMVAASPADRPTAGTVARSLGQVPGGAHIRPTPIELPKEGRLTRLLPSVPGLRRPSREPDVRHQPDATP